MTQPDRDDYLWDRSGPADPEVARLEQLLAPLAHDAPLDELRLRRRSRARGMAIAAIAAVAAAAVAILWWRWPAERAPAEPYACGAQASGFRFTARGGGSVACGGSQLAEGVLPVGEVLDTGAHQAELAIADIGRAELGAQTRVRLDRTGTERHQLFLERGRLHARVSAPPRIFAVGTPGARVTDLGCEYTLDIDDAGRGTIAVATGKVELESGTGRIVVVPARTHARLLAGRHAGLPLVGDASEAITTAVVAYEDGAADGVDLVLAAAAANDGITLASLAELVPADRRRSVLERLAALVPLPQPLTLDEVVADHARYERWFDAIVLVHLARTAMSFDRK